MPKQEAATQGKLPLSAILSLVLRLGLGGIFIASGAAKLAHLEQFYLTAQGYKILTPELIQLYAGWLPWLEILAGTCLIAGLFSRAGAILTSLLLGSFLVALGWVLLRGDAIDCGCFLGGGPSKPVTWELWFRDLAMLAGSLALLKLKPDPWRLDALLQNRAAWKQAGAVILTLYCLTTGMMAVNSKTPEPPPPPPPAMQTLLPDGSSAPPFELKDLDGKSIALSDFRDQKLVLLEFFATWCPHCQHSVPMLNKLQKTYAKQLQVLAINAGDTQGTPSTAPAFQQQFHIAYPILDSPSSQLLNMYHISGFPTFYLVDKRGNIIWSHAGTLDRRNEAVIKKALRQS